jgi:GH25 family lysozyme M1 (1,4-beta-N-acetylmuramidase)
MTTAFEFADISSNNPLPFLGDYKAAGHKHICRKVSEGTGYHWLAGDTVADQAHAHGLAVGHYHWLRPEQSATAQAAYFVTLVRPHLKPGDWLMADFERTANVADPADVIRAAQLEQFTTEVHKQLPTFPLYVYTGNWYLDGKPHCQAAVRKWPVVMSNYSGDATLPNPYRLNYVAWQFTDRAHVAGFSQPVDYNRWLISPDHTRFEDHMALSPEALAQIDALVARRLNALFTDSTPGGDGKVHTNASQLQHIVKGRPYLSQAKPKKKGK